MDQQAGDDLEMAAETRLVEKTNREVRRAFQLPGGFSGVQGTKRRRSRAAPENGVPQPELGNEGNSAANKRQGIVSYQVEANEVIFICHSERSEAE